MKRILLSIIPFLLLSGCASLHSLETPATKPRHVDGLTYFMPKKDIIVTIKVADKNKIEGVEVKTSDAYPDLSKQYILRYGRNLFGKNTLDVGVNEKGLLQTANSKTDNQISEVLDSIAEIAAYATKSVRLRDPAKPPTLKKCTLPKGEYSFSFPGPVDGKFLNKCVAITIKKIEKNDKVSGHYRSPGRSMPGIFYRQSEPYSVTVTFLNQRFTSLAFSPSRAKTHFLPISRTFFSDNEADRKSVV